MKGRSVYFFVPTVFSAVVLFSCSRSGEGETGAADRSDPGEMRAVAVEGTKVTRGSLVNEIRSAGIVEGIREAWIVSQAEGPIRDVDFNLGEQVRRDQVLITLDGDLAARNRELAEGRYRTALLEFQAAERTKGSGSVSALQYSQVSDRLLAAEASWAAAVDAYENTMIKAPFDGAVAARGAGLSVGSYMARGVRVARIVDNSAFQTEISVGEGQILLIQEGAAARIIGNDGVVRTGRVSAVSAGSDGSTGSFTVVVEWIPVEGDRLKSGMSVDVSIDAANDDEKIIVPASAIRIRSGVEFVFVDNAGSTQSRQIKTGNRLGERVEVLEGLQEGLIVITSGLASLAPGIPVRTTLVNVNGEF